MSASDVNARLPQHPRQTALTNKPGTHMSQTVPARTTQPACPYQSSFLSTMIVVTLHFILRVDESTSTDCFHSLNLEKVETAGATKKHKILN